MLPAVTQGICNAFGRKICLLLLFLKKTNCFHSEVRFEWLGQNQQFQCQLAEWAADCVRLALCSFVPPAIAQVLGCPQPVSLALALQHPLVLQPFASSFLTHRGMPQSLLTKRGQNRGQEARGAPRVSRPRPVTLSLASRSGPRAQPMPAISLP